MKLKENIIRPVESPRPALECLSAICIGMALPVVLAVIVRIISEFL